MLTSNFSQQICLVQAVKERKVFRPFASYNFAFSSPRRRTEIEISELESWRESRRVERTEPPPRWVRDDKGGSNRGGYM
jgi:hypothetical protein